MFITLWTIFLKLQALCPRLTLHQLRSLIISAFANCALKRYYFCVFLCHLMPFDILIIILKYLWSRHRESNPRPHPYHGCALPTELYRPGFKIWFLAVDSVTDIFLLKNSSTPPRRLITPAAFSSRHYPNQSLTHIFAGTRLVLRAGFGQKYFSAEKFSDPVSPDVSGSDFRIQLIYLPTIYLQVCRHMIGAEGRIRTCEGIKPTDLQSVAFDRFATSAQPIYGATCRIRTDDLLFTKQLL